MVIGRRPELEERIVIVVDSSAWINWLNRVAGPTTEKLDDDIDPLDIIVGDIVLLEVLQGARNDRHAGSMRHQLNRFQIEPILSPALAIKAADNYRLLRSVGYTVRKIPDIIIGTFCLEHDYALLQADRDFLPMVEHLGLRLA
jgi:predicted nucleic acid-binding protein